MRLVQDLVFVESIEFYLHEITARLAKAGTFSMGDAATRACAEVGIELIEYDTIFWHPAGNRVRIELYSKAWRTRWERTADLLNR